MPVLATVLCLTLEELAQAVRSMEQAAGLTGVASSFWENVGSRFTVSCDDVVVAAG